MVGGEEVGRKREERKEGEREGGWEIGREGNETRDGGREGG